MIRPMNTLTRLAPDRTTALHAQQHSYPAFLLLLAAFCLTTAVLLLGADSPLAALPCFLASACLAFMAIHRVLRDLGRRPRRPKRRSPFLPTASPAGRELRSRGRSP